MAGLLEKDFCLLLQRKQTMVIFLALSLLISFTTDVTFAVGYLSILCVMFTISTLSYDEIDNGYVFLMTLPIDNKTYVREKYFLCSVSSVLAWLVSVVLCFISFIFKSETVNPKETMLTFLVFIPIILFVVAIMIPIQLKFGAEKSRTVIVIFAGCLAVIGFLANKILHALGISIWENLKFLNRIPDTWIVAILIAIAFAILILSYFCSRFIMGKKVY